MEKLFESATRNKIRFDYRGSISVEDLWDLSVEELDIIYKNLMTKKKASETESLLSEKKTSPVLETKIEIVKYIFGVKIDEEKAAEQRAENAAKKQKILAILAKKQDAELENKSAEELEKLIADL